MKTENKAGRTIVLFLIMLSLAALACGFPSGDDATTEPAVVSETVEESEPAGPSAANESQDAPQEPQPEPTVAEPAAAEETGPDGGDENPAETGELSSLIKPTSLDDIPAMQVIMVSENLDSGETMEASYSFIRPDRYLTNLVGMETLAIGETAYMKIGGAEWTEQPLLPAAITANAVEDTARAFAELAVIYDLLADPSGSNLTLEGEETINGVDTLVYTFDGGMTSPLSGIIHGQITVWLGKADGLLYRQTVVNSTDSGLGPRSSATADIIYGDAVTIEGPN